MIPIFDPIPKEEKLPYSIPPIPLRGRMGFHIFLFKDIQEIKSLGCPYFGIVVGAVEEAIVVAVVTGEIWDISFRVEYVDRFRVIHVGSKQSHLMVVV
jgi:hypothetical protein